MFEPIIHQLEISGPQMEETYALTEGATTIGRQATNNLVFVHPLVSRKHAELVVTAVTCRIMDLGSTHGTQINREAIEPETAVLLTNGDVIEIGAFRLVYKKTEIVIADPEPKPAAPEQVGDAGEPAAENGEETAVSEPEAAPKAEKTKPPAPSTPKPTVTSKMQEWKTASYVPVSSGSGGRGSDNGKPTAKDEEEPFELPPGQSFTYSRYLEYLPEIYRTTGETFIPRFLALLESILAPVEWTGDNFDLFLDAKSSPVGFLPWLANWYELDFDPTWSETAMRTVLQEAHLIYRRRGTAWAMQRLLEIYTGTSVQIEDNNDNMEDFTFSVRIAASSKAVNRTAIEDLINANKPAHTSYDLMFVE
ncbi:MAG: phage tail protein I [Anaerolineae bacterium]|nr:phage tail protein I [Anaerolineae bacterium]